MQKAITSRVVETKPIFWRNLQFIQHSGFKELTELARHRLKSSLLENHFIQPFYVCEIEGFMYCLDGFHRNDLLEELITDGVDVPLELPATFIDISDKKEAARMVLVFSSAYAKVLQQGLNDFITLNDLEWSEIKDTIDLPDFSEERYEQKFNIYETETAEEPEVPIEEHSVVKEGDLFVLNGHRILCGSFRDESSVSLLMGEDKARIVNCDPPYNLPANFFTNKDEKRHKDFAMGHGEMSDDEFVQFLALIMQRSVENTVPGAIHYIFMDFRHMWHMTEAARRIYGNPEPKQMCVWVKDMMANGSFYRAQQELCFIFSNEQAKALWNNDIVDYGGFYKNEQELVYIFKNGGDDVKHLSHLSLEKRIRSNVWRYPSATSVANPDRYELKNHPTPKPVVMIADSILDTTNEGEIVVDWFLGSGTCLIACEQTGRKCYATEISPYYVQSIIKRYLNFCHKRGIAVNFTHLNGDLTINDFKDGSK